MPRREAPPAASIYYIIRHWVLPLSHPVPHPHWNNPSNATGCYQSLSHPMHPTPGIILATPLGATNCYPTTQCPTPHPTGIILATPLGATSRYPTQCTPGIIIATPLGATNRYPTQCTQWRLRQWDRPTTSAHRWSYYTSSTKWIKWTVFFLWFMTKLQHNEASKFS